MKANKAHNKVRLQKLLRQFGVKNSEDAQLNLLGFLEILIDLESEGTNE